LPLSGSTTLLKINLAALTRTNSLKMIIARSFLQKVLSKNKWKITCFCDSLMLHFMNKFFSVHLHIIIIIMLKKGVFHLNNFSFIDTFYEIMFQFFSLKQNYIVYINLILSFDASFSFQFFYFKPSENSLNSSTTPPKFSCFLKELILIMHSLIWKYATKYHKNHNK